MNKKVYVLYLYSELTGKFQNFKIPDRFEEGGPPVNLLGADDRGGVAGGGGAEVHLAHPHGGGVQHVLRLVDESLHSTEKNYYYQCGSGSGKKIVPDPGSSGSEMTFEVKLLYSVKLIKFGNFSTQILNLKM